jgi:hypothetical protein
MRTANAGEPATGQCRCTRQVGSLRVGGRRARPSAAARPTTTRYFRAQRPTGREPGSWMVRAREGRPHHRSRAARPSTTQHRRQHRAPEGRPGQQGQRPRRELGAEQPRQVMPPPPRRHQSVEGEGVPGAHPVLVIHHQHRPGPCAQLSRCQHQRTAQASRPSDRQHPPPDDPRRREGQVEDQVGRPGPPRPRGRNLGKSTTLRTTLSTAVGTTARRGCAPARSPGSAPVGGPAG